MHILKCTLFVSGHAFAQSWLGFLVLCWKVSLSPQAPTLQLQAPARLARDHPVRELCVAFFSRLQKSTAGLGEAAGATMGQSQ